MHGVLMVADQSPGDLRFMLDQAVNLKKTISGRMEILQFPNA